MTACPCCGYLTIQDDWDVCPVCYWENDPLQLREPDMPGGANQVSLREAQSNFEQFGACEESMIPYVRNEGYVRDSNWRPLTQTS
jgi:hypothetical protein